MFFSLVVVATATGARALRENQKPMTHRSSALLSKYLAFAELDLTFEYKYIKIVILVVEMHVFQFCQCYKHTYSIIFNTY